MVHHNSHPYKVGPQQGYTRCNQNDRRYPNHRHNYRPEVSNNECESRATMAVAKALNKLTENFARMQNQPLTTSALSAIDWFDGTDMSNTMSWLDQVENGGRKEQPSTIRGRHG